MPEFAASTFVQADPLQALLLRTSPGLQLEKTNKTNSHTVSYLSLLDAFLLIRCVGAIAQHLVQTQSKGNLA